MLPKRRNTVTANSRRLTSCRLRMEPLEPRHLLAANPILTEFMASNNTTINDGFGSDNDWIEIQNAGDTAVELRGYHLTDNASNLTKWTFKTSTVLQPSEYLLVFASGLDTIDPSGFQHTGFKLSAGGEYVALVAPDETVLSEFGVNGSDYPPQLTDTSFGNIETTLLTGDTIVDFLIPTSTAGAWGTSWTTTGFDTAASGFQSGAAAIGYEGGDTMADTSYSNHIKNDVPIGTSGVYIRHEFNLTDASAITGLDLNLQSDDGVVVYLNGQIVVSDRAPSPLLWSSTARSGHPDADVLAGVDFPLSNFTTLLKDGPNVLALHLLNGSSGSSDLLIVPTLTTRGSGYFARPTPGSTNSDLIRQGPLILDVTATPEIPVAGQPIKIEAEVSPYLDPLDNSTIEMTYRRMFQNDVTLVMRDDGLEGDITANDGVFTATIPSSAIQAGEMIRWFVSADDTTGLNSRAPRFLDPLDSAEYFGTVTPDPTASTDVPVMHWFVEDEVAVDTRDGTRTSLFYRDTFYDNIQVDLHGQSTSTFAKKSHDFDANTGEKFDIADGVGKASDFNLLTNYSDQTKLRHPLAYDVFRQAGLPTSLSFTVSLHRNGQFYGLFDFVEEGDEEQLRRLNLDEDNNLYKVNNRLNSAFAGVEQKTGADTTRDDLQELVDGHSLGNNHDPATHNWDWDNLDMADLVNYLAIQHFIQNSDFGHKNMYWYHDVSGTGLWSALPWDLDFSFGHKWDAQDGYFSNDLITIPDLNGGRNDLFQRLLSNSEFKKMHDRRLRTLMDQFLGERGTPIADSWLAQEMITRKAVLANEFMAELARWPNEPGFAGYPNNPAEAIDQQLNTWLPTRRNVLEGINSIPDAHGDTSDLRIGTIEYAPSGGNLNQQYVVIENSEEFAVDISGWTIGGSITHTFKPGTVIDANDELHLAANVQGFLSRTTSPRGGQQLFVQGSNSGTWNPASGILDLRNVAGTVIDSGAYGINSDFTGDGNRNCVDIDLVSRLAGSQTYSAAYDLTGDGAVNKADVAEWLNQAAYLNLPAGASYQYGDANLDGRVSDQDFGEWNAKRFTSGAAWCDADFNTDGIVDNSDFVLWNLNKHSQLVSTNRQAPIPRAAPPAATVVVDAAFAESTSTGSVALATHANAEGTERATVAAVDTNDGTNLKPDRDSRGTTLPTTPFFPIASTVPSWARIKRLTSTDADDKDDDSPWWNDDHWDVFE